MRIEGWTFTWAAVLALAAAHAQGSVIWEGPASSSTGVVFGNLNCDAPGSIRPATDPVHGPVWAYDKPSGSDRCENHGIRVDGTRYVFQEGSTYYLGWRSALSSTVNNNASFQWKSYGTHIQNYPVLLKMINGRLTLQYRAPGEPCCRTLWSAPITPYTWNSQVLGLHLSSVATEGWIEFWFNGEPQTLTGGVTRYHGRTLDDINEPKWGVYGASATHVTNYVHGLKVGTTYDDVALGGGGSFPTPTPTPVPPGLRYEAESIPLVAAGASTAVQNDVQNSGGRWMALLADGPGDFVDYTLAGVPAGVYDLRMKYKAHPNRGIATMHLDGQPIGPAELDQYSNPPAYPEILLGTLRAAYDGDHVVRQTVVGKNPAAGNHTLSADLFVLLPDEVPPALELPADLVVEATSPAGAVATFAATAIDDKDGPVPVTLTPPSGSTFALGSTTVTATAMDTMRNVATGSFVVRVVDTTPPVLTVPPDLTITTCDRPAIGTATATDVASTPVVTNDAPARFVLGTTIVTWRAVDPSGNEATGVQRVTVELGDDESCCPAGTKVLVGTGATNVLTGTAGGDCILGRGGDDVLSGLGGDDFISSGAGRDTVAAGPGNDLVMAGDGDDVVDASLGDDVVRGGHGRDTIAAGPGSDDVDGGAGTDVCDVPADGSDVVAGCP